jgi:hypothetical protein
MKYEKPELIVAGEAVEAIQANLTKSNKTNDVDQMSPHTSAAAYSADE